MVTRDQLYTDITGPWRDPPFEPSRHLCSRISTQQELVCTKADDESIDSDAQPNDQIKRRNLNKEQIIFQMNESVFESGFVGPLIFSFFSSWDSVISGVVTVTTSPGRFKATMLSSESSVAFAVLVGIISVTAELSFAALSA